MEPIPETREAVDEFGPFSDDHLDLVAVLQARAERVRSSVPELVGLSLSVRAEGVTFTLAATDVVAASLDALQFLDDGPCLAAAREGEVLDVDYDVPSESEWQLFAMGAAASGVASSLTLPIVEDGRVSGTVNLYASSADAFHGHHNEVASIFRAWAEGAVTNADLSFSTLHEARKAPGRLRASVRVEVAAGLLASAAGMSLERARDALADAAGRAGVDVPDLAEVVISALQGAS